MEAVFGGDAVLNGVRDSFTEEMAFEAETWSKGESNPETGGEGALHAEVA